MILEFDDEMLVAKVNLVAYRKIYALEGWLRRICTAAWMAKFGSAWDQKIDPRLKKTIQGRITRNSQRLYLGAESSNDLIWQATHSELLQMLTAEEIADTILSLTGATPAFLEIKLNETREVRNLLAHNHALSERTYTILSGLLASLEETVDTFKARVLYGADSEIFLGHDHPISSRLERLLEKNDWSQFQAFVGRRGDFLEYWSLPAAFETRPRWPDAELLLYYFRDHLSDIVAFCLNKQGWEFAILVPLALPLGSHESLCDAFVEHRSTWTKVRFEKQNPRFACNPKIWFHENASGPSPDRSPIRDSRYLSN